MLLQSTISTLRNLPASTGLVLADIVSPLATELSLSESTYSYEYEYYYEHLREVESLG